MPSPFPGMNPYLENPELWSEVHHRLITAIADALEPELSRKYRVAIEKRTYLSDGEDTVLVGIPDVAVFSQRVSTTQTSSVATLPEQAELVTVTIPNQMSPVIASYAKQSPRLWQRSEISPVIASYAKQSPRLWQRSEGHTIPLSRNPPEEVREGYLEIREVATGYVVTALEILSPKNKRAGVGRNKYEEKRRAVLSSPTHLVEIDLLRGGKPMRFLSDIPQTDYRILVSRSESPAETLRERRPQAQLYAFSVRQQIPKFMLPLQAGDKEPLVDLQAVLVGVYSRARFDMAIDYTSDRVPPIEEDDRVWADTLLVDKGLR